MTLSELRAMPLNDTMVSEEKDLRILRVPGGWIYESYDVISDAHEHLALSSVFVPDPLEWAAVEIAAGYASDGPFLASSIAEIAAGQARAVLDAVAEVEA